MSMSYCGYLVAMVTFELPSPSDFCMTYKDMIDKKGTEEEVKKSSAKRAVKRKAYLEALEAKGIEFEYQEPKVSSTWDTGSYNLVH